jgi:hypothetical protein
MAPSSSTLYDTKSPTIVSWYTWYS